MVQVRLQNCFAVGMRLFFRCIKDEMEFHCVRCDCAVLICRRGAGETTMLPQFLGSPAAFLNSISQLHFVDCGLNCRGTFPTDPTMVTLFMKSVESWRRSQWDASIKRARPGAQERSLGTDTRAGSQGAFLKPFDVFLHGTPRQWADKRRRWIAQEKEAFVSLLVGNGASVYRWLFQPYVPTPSLLGCESDLHEISFGKLEQNPPQHQEAAHAPLQDGIARLHEILYFSNEKGSMDMHFRVIACICFPTWK